MDKLIHEIKFHLVLKDIRRPYLHYFPICDCCEYTVYPDGYLHNHIFDFWVEYYLKNTKAYIQISGVLYSFYEFSYSKSCLTNLTINKHVGVHGDFYELKDILPYSIYKDIVDTWYTVHIPKNIFYYFRKKDIKIQRKKCVGINKKDKSCKLYQTYHDIYCRYHIPPSPIYDWNIRNIEHSMILNKNQCTY